MNPRKLLALAGIVAPPLYCLSIIVVGTLRPDYHFATEVVSMLMVAGAPYKAELIGLFTCYNALSVLFAFRVLEWIHDRREWRGLGYSGAAMMMVVAIAGAVRVGFFPMDPLGAPVTLRGLTHLGLAGLSSVAAVTAQVVLGLWCWRIRGSDWIGIYSVVSGVALFVAIVLTGASTLVAFQFAGLLEKIGILVYLQWTLVLAVRLYRDG